jgi:hypothetical protein
VLVERPGRRNYILVMRRSGVRLPKAAPQFPRSRPVLLPEDRQLPITLAWIRHANIGVSPRHAVHSMTEANIPTEPAHRGHLTRSSARLNPRGARAGSTRAARASCRHWHRPHLHLRRDRRSHPTRGRTAGRHLTDQLREIDRKDGPGRPPHERPLRRPRVQRLSIGRLGSVCPHGGPGSLRARR